jgi:ubiquinone/menaquinone biosynthesis C-methylase UbiE
MRHVERFEGLAVEYDRWREDYPAALFADVLAEAPAWPPLAADVGAGTGLATARLLQAAPPDWTVMAVEPGADMRARLRARFAAEPRVRVVASPGEILPVGAGALAAITVCAAFHWLDQPAFLAEARRALTPGGALAVVRNNRVEGPAMAALSAWLKRHSDAATPWRQSCSEQAAILAAAPGFGPVMVRLAPWERTLDRDGLIALALTRSSAVPALRRLGREAVEAALREVYADAAGDAPTRLVYEATALIVRRRR